MKILFKFFFLLLALPAFPQKVKDHINRRPDKEVSITVTQIEDARGSGIRSYMVLDTRQVRSASFLKDAPQSIRMIIDNRPYLLYNVTDTNTTVLIDEEGNHDGKRVKPKDILLSYRGVAEGVLEDQSLVSINISLYEISGFINLMGVNYVLARFQGRDIAYKEQDLELEHPFKECNYLEAPGGKNIRTDYLRNWYEVESQPFLRFHREREAILGVGNGGTKKVVQWYWETDYDLFVANGNSFENVNLHIRGLFSQMQTLYANDNITVTLKTLFIWTTVDPYTGTSANQYLDQFWQYRKTWDGDLAHLLGTKGNGGVAWVDGVSMCDYYPAGQKVQYQQGYSGGIGVYNTVPTYSWSVECTAHECGHQLGSPHTHDCRWSKVPLRKIDSCGQMARYSKEVCELIPPSEGGSTMVKGSGSIMSYCHLTAIGISFANGFGILPKTLIQERINASGCLADSGTTVTCPKPPKPSGYSGSATGTTFVSSDVIGASSYQWSFPSGWNWNNNSAFLPLSRGVNVVRGSVSGTASVAAVNACGAGAAYTFSVTGTGIVAPPCTPKKEINTIACPVNYSGVRIQVRDSSCTTGWTAWRDSINTCKLDTPTTCVFVMPGNDTTYYRIRDTITRSTLSKPDINGALVPYYIQVSLVCVTCCKCYNHQYDWWINDVYQPKHKNKPAIYFQDALTLERHYKKGDKITLLVSSTYKTIGKRCINAPLVNYYIR